MADHSVTRRQPADVVLQPAAGGTVAQRTQSQLAELRAITRLGLVEYDLTYFQVSAYLELNRTGRSPAHQKRMQDLGGHLMAGYDIAHDRVMSNARQDVTNNRPEVIVQTVTKYVAPPRKSLFQRLSRG
jgi:hypothetical protein